MNDNLGLVAEAIGLAGKLARLRQRRISFSLLEDIPEETGAASKGDTATTNRSHQHSEKRAT